jgi:hypothetical protein
MIYGYDMGITVNGTAIPDPSDWTYEVADLDTSAKRDVTGYLHRNRVATKVNYEFEWKGIGWDALATILNGVSGASFSLSAPDPRTCGGVYSGDYYVGNRTGSNHWFWKEHEEKGMYSLKLKFIEY